jgi:diguanylate cyclase (GGDEF)-like protein
MSRKRNHILVGLITALFIAASAALFLPSPHLLVIFAVYLFLIFSMQLLGFGAAAFMMVAFASLMAVFCMTKVPHEQVLAIPSLLVSLYIASFLLYWHGEKLAQRRRHSESEADDAQRDIQSLSTETAFYENRLRELGALGERRRKLSHAAHELGALLDPAEIQRKLIEAAQSLFPTRPVALSYGQQNDPVDNVVIQRRNSVMIPDGSMRLAPQGNPLLAVPVFAQQNVAGVLRVGGDAGPVFGRDDFRLLEILASLASLSLDNSILFGQVQDTALRDGLTGLITHKAFQEHLEAQILEASRYKEPLSVIIADVDHFKSVNDTHGHQAGDQILQGFSHVLARNVRDVDVVSRYGGEEFAILLLQTGEEAAHALAEAIRRDVAGQPFETSGPNLSITASFGVATFPEDATSAQQLLRKADERLYQAKQSGRNRVKGKW